jgi:hypothetical protein
MGKIFKLKSFDYFVCTTLYLPPVANLPPVLLILHGGAA